MSQQIDKFSMHDTIKAEEISLADLFGPKFLFTVPIFQRPFSWTVENFDILFEDIVGAQDNSSGQQQYFLGSILLQESADNSYYLVDGQQRMTSIAILLASIRDKTTNPILRDSIKSYLYQQKDEFKNIPEKMRITPWEELKDLFREYVYEVSGTQRFVEDFATKIKYTGPRRSKISFVRSNPNILQKG